MTYQTMNDVSELQADMVLFKHSKTCGTSAKAKMAIDRLAQELPVTLLVVQDQRELSQAIAQELGIKHESPQLIIRKMGRVACVLNHWHISERIAREVLGAQHSH
jgi:bacillithiol system protein YtxJ